MTNDVVDCDVHDLGMMLLKHSYRKGKFTLTSGKTSDFYIDGKKTFLNGKGLWLTSRCFLKMIRDGSRKNNLEIQAVAGVTLGADPLIAGVSMLSFMEVGPHMPQIIIRKEPKKHGSGNQLEVAGSIKPGATVALIDDVMTTGGTTINIGVKALEREGYKIGMILLIVDREEGGREFLVNCGYNNVYSIFTRSELLAMK